MVGGGREEYEDDEADVGPEEAGVGAKGERV